MLIVLVEMTGVPVDNIDDYDDDYYDDDSTESKMWQDFLPHKKLSIAFIEIDNIAYLGCL